MSTAELNELRLDLIKWISNLSDQNILGLIEAIKHSDRSGDWWAKLTSDEQQAIEKGIEDLNNGKKLPSSEFWRQLMNDKKSI